jgi:hypothetical protein
MIETVDVVDRTRIILIEWCVRAINTVESGTHKTNAKRVALFCSTRLQIKT